jgi:hypothetical protein
MDGTTLKNLMKNISLYFGKKEPSLETYGEWMKDLISIPNEPMPWIESKLKANKYPDNPPKAIRSLWYQWLEENPDKTIRDQAGCPDCIKGWLWASKNGESKGFRCRYCNNQGNQPGLAVTREDLQSHGWNLHWSHGTLNQIKTMPHFAIGKQVMPKGIQKWAEENFQPVIEQDWREQF